MASRLNVNSPPLFARNLINHPTPNRVLYILVPVLLTTRILYLSVLDYKAWYALGKSGVPHNIIGWLVQSLLRPFAKESFSTACYTDPKIISSAGTQGRTAYLSPDDVPQREGKRPAVGNWVVPHRQLDEGADPETKQYIQTFIKNQATASPSQLKIETSHLERHGPALKLRTTPSRSEHPVAYSVGGEIEHMHDSDGSLHVVLAPQDAKLVIERGWGQRHGLSGRALWCGFLLVYAPRDEKEKTVSENILKAGIAFMLAEFEK